MGRTGLVEHGGEPGDGLLEALDHAVLSVIDMHATQE